MDVKEIYLNIIKAIYNKSIAKNIFNCEKVKTFPLRSEIKQTCPISLLPFNTILELLAKAFRQEIEVKNL